MKVALFLPSLGGGGMEWVLMNLAWNLAEQDLEVELVLANAERPYGVMLLAPLLWPKQARLPGLMSAGTVGVDVYGMAVSLLEAWRLIDKSAR